MAYLLQQLLDQSAQRFPERTAVWARDRTLTYGQLEVQSNQLARFLVESGVQRGDRVGLLFPKAVESVVSMLGVLKAGAAYVPLDPMAPSRRIGYIVGNCGIRTLISDRTRFDGLERDTRRSLHCCLLTMPSSGEAEAEDRVFSWDALAAFPETPPPEVGVIETDLAYILYTSGSTGQPKGVMLSHRNALTFVDWCAGTFRIRPEDRLSNHAPLHFDLSVFDIYNSIEGGATVHLVPEQTAVFPASLAEFIESHALTVWYSVPSALISLMHRGELEKRGFDPLRLVLFAGEVFPLKYLRKLAALLPGVDLYNLYGPTETNVCTYYRVDRSRLQDLERLPIGQACANTEVFVLDERGQPSPPGEVGELCVRGPSVTPGYWGDPEKTRLAVMDDPRQEQWHERTYRTGDLVTLGADGNYDFLGRRDSMIKSRGFRIELGEIEAALYAMPGVREAAAVAIPDEEVGNRIKAFVVPQDPGALTALQVQQHCAKGIPRYMIPELIEFCADLPRTSTGKVDRPRLAGLGTS